MDYIVPGSWTQTLAQASGTTYAITLPPNIQAGDYIGVWIVQDGTGGTTISESGGSAFTFLGTQSTTGAIRTAYCFDASATGGGSDVLTVACNSAAIWAVSFLVRGHHTSPHGATPTSGTDFVYSTAATIGTSGVQAGAMTTANAYTLNMYFVGMDSATNFRCSMAEAYFPVTYQDTNFGCGAGYNPATSTTAVRPTFYGSNSGEGIQIFSLAIRPATADARMPYCDPHMVELDWLSNISPNNPNMAPTWGVPSSPITINGLAVDATPSVTENYNQIANPDTSLSWDSFKQIACAANLGAAAWVGKKLTFGAAKDVTNHILNVVWNHGHSNTAAHVGDKGIAIRLSDGTNWVAYQLEPKSTFASGAVKSVQIELGVATALDSSGTVATCLAGVSSIEFLWHRLNGTTSPGIFNFINLVAFDRDTPATIRGGDATLPADFSTYAEAHQSFNAYRLAQKQASAQIMAKASMTIGDGTNAVYWDSGSLEFPRAYAPATQNTWRVGTSKVGVTVKPQSGDTVKLRAGAFISEGQQSLTIASTASTSATYDFSGETLSNLLYTDDAGISLSNVTVKRSPKAVFNSTTTRTLTNWSFTETTASDAPVAVNGNGMTLSGCTLSCDKQTGVSSYHLELGTAVTATTLADVTFSGTPGTDKIHVKYPETTVADSALVVGRRYKIKTVGTTNWTSIGASAATIGTEFTKNATAVTGTGGDAYEGVIITISGTTSLVDADIAKDAANTPVKIAAPELYQSATIASITTTMRIQLYDLTSSTELYNGVPGVTSYTWTDATPAAASREIRLRVMETTMTPGTPILMIDQPIGTCGVLEGTEAISFTVVEEEDTVYTANNVNGSTITGITITDSSLLLEIDSGTVTTIGGVDVVLVELKDLYAYETYWLSTEEGIRDEARFINAIDPANYSFTDFKIRNDTAYPVGIVGGYAKDAATDSSLTLVDYAGAEIHFLPDHVVNNVITVGGAVIDGTVADVVSGVFNEVIENSKTFKQLTRINTAVLAGTVSGAGTGTETFVGIDGTTNRVVSTVDDSGNRTAVALNGA